MAEPCICPSLYQNPLLGSEDELTKAALETLTNDNCTLSHILAMSHIPISALALPLIPAKLVAKYTNVNLYRAIKLALELFV